MFATKLMKNINFEPQSVISAISLTQEFKGSADQYVRLCVFELNLLSLPGQPCGISSSFRNDSIRNGIQCLVSPVIKLKQKPLDAGSSPAWLMLICSIDYMANSVLALIRASLNPNFQHYWYRNGITPNRNALTVPTTAWVLTEPPGLKRSTPWLRTRNSAMNLPFVFWSYGRYSANSQFGAPMI